MERFLDGTGEGSTDQGLADEMIRLKARHRDIERRLAELERHLSLTTDEQVERARLKKEKLWSKDRMTALALQSTATTPRSWPARPGATARSSTWGSPTGARRCSIRRRWISTPPESCVAGCAAAGWRRASPARPP